MTVPVVDLWRRNLLSVWPGLFATSLGLMAVIPALPFYLEERYGLTDPGELESWTALAFGAAPLAAAICGPLWGALGDRVGRKAMVLRAQIAIAISLSLMPLAPDPYWFTALRWLQGMFAGFIAPAMALVSADVPAERQGRVIARLQQALALGLALGPPAAAEVIGWWGRDAVFWMAGGLALLSACSVAIWAEDGPVPQAPPGERRYPRIRDVVTDPVFLSLLLLVLVLRFGLHMVEPFTALWIRELGALPWFGAPDSARAVDRTAALAFSVLALGQLLVTPIWGSLSDRVGPVRCLAMVAIALALVLALTSQVTSAQHYLALRCLAAVFMAGVMTLSYAAVASRGDPSRKALSFGTLQSCAHLGLALGPLAGGLLVPEFGLRPLFLVASSVVLVAGIGALVLRRIWPGRRPTDLS